MAGAHQQRIALAVRLRQPSRLNTSLSAGAARGQSILPVPNPLLVCRQLLRLAPQGFGLRAPVETEECTPLPRWLVAQRFWRANPGHAQKREQEQGTGQSIIPLGQGLAAGRVAGVH